MFDRFGDIPGCFGVLWPVSRTHSRCAALNPDRRIQRPIKRRSPGSAPEGETEVAFLSKTSERAVAYLTNGFQVHRSPLRDKRMREVRGWGGMGGVRQRLPAFLEIPVSMRLAAPTPHHSSDLCVVRVQELGSMGTGSSGPMQAPTHTQQPSRAFLVPDTETQTQYYQSGASRFLMRCHRSDWLVNTPAARPSQRILDLRPARP